MRLPRSVVVCLSILGAAILQANCAEPEPAQEEALEADSRPNILLVMVDDMGWTDIGPFGSEIEGDTAVVLEAVDAMMRAAMAAGASRVTIQLNA